jgi:hypothetical protein
VAFDDAISLPANGWHVKSVAKILLIFQLITTDDGETLYARGTCAPGRNVALAGAGSPAPGTTPPVMRPEDRQQGCFAAGFGLWWIVVSRLPHAGFFWGPEMAVQVAKLWRPQRAAADVVEPIPNDLMR